MRTYFQRRQVEIYNAYKTSAALGHSVPKGNERELIASQFLSQHLPFTMQVTSGVLIDQDTVDFSKLSQTNSPQLDLLLVFSNRPQLTLYGGTRIFFAESVISVIEVKTNISSSDIDALLKHCCKVKERRRQALGLFFANSNDSTTRPSVKVPYYVIAFDSNMDAQEIMTLLREKGSQANLSEQKQMELYPDGIFILNPDMGTVLLKDIGLHSLGTDLKMPPYSGGELKTDSLCSLWFSLMAQFESIRLLNFPLNNYASKLFPKPETGK